MTNEAALNDLAFSFPDHDSIFKQPTIEQACDINFKEFLESKLSRAFTEGATIGTLSSISTISFPIEISSHISSFFSRKDGGRLAQTCKLANEAAKENEWNILMSLH